MVRRKSGWEICVLPCVFGGLCFGFMICQAACDHLCPCRSFLNNSFFSCKDRALERDRPYQRKKRGKESTGHAEPTPNIKKTKQNQATKANNSRQQTHGKGTRDNTNKNQTTKKRTTQRRPKKDNQSRPNRASRTLQTPTSPRETKQTRRTKKARGQKVDRQTGDQSKLEKRKQIKYKCTCPVCGQTHEYKGGQDQNMGREDRAEAEVVLSSLRVCL